MTLRPYQQKMLERHLALLRKRGVTCDRSETGTGKTPPALAAARALGVKLTVVVCPKTLKSHWARWGTELGFQDGELIILGWEETKLGKYPQIYQKTRGWFGGRSVQPRSVLLIFDEAHRSKSFRSQNTRMVRWAVTSGAYLYLISATLVQSSIDLGGLAFPLKLIAHQNDWFKFAGRFGAGLNEFNAYHDFAAPHQLQALYELLDSVGVRVRKKEVVGKDLVISQVDLLDSGSLQEILSIFSDLSEKVRALEGKKNAASQAIVARLHARQAVELAKVPLFVEEALRHLEEGAKVAIFLNFRESVAEALRQFAMREVLARSITGDTPLSERDQLISEFNERFLHVLVLNIQAGGEGISLHDQDGQYHRVTLISPPESATLLVQALGRIDRVGSQSVGLNRVIFVAKTAEELVHRNVSLKMQKLDLLNDGDLAL